MMTEFQKECIRWHGKNLTGNYAHYCPDWDYLPIDDTCVEFQSCTCPKLPMDDTEEVIDGDEGSEDGPSPQNSAKDKPLIDNLLGNFFEGWKV